MHRIVVSYRYREMGLLAGLVLNIEGSVNYCYGESGVQFTGHEKKSLSPHSINLLQGLCS